MNAGRGKRRNWVLIISLTFLLAVSAAAFYAVMVWTDLPGWGNVLVLYGFGLPMLLIAGILLCELFWPADADTIEALWSAGDRPPSWLKPWLEK